MTRGPLLLATVTTLAAKPMQGDADSDAGRCVAPQPHPCGVAAQFYSPAREILERSESAAYIPSYAALHKWSGPMIALIEKFLDAMFAPLARELERLPPQALRFNVFF
jgi:hypothetical protein